MKTNFEKVVEFNKCFGLPHKEEPNHAVTKDDPKLTKLRLDLILEETRELQEAIENHDFTDLECPVKSIRNSPWSMPPELIFVSEEHAVACIDFQ